MYRYDELRERAIFVHRMRCRGWLFREISAATGASISWLTSAYYKHFPHGPTPREVTPAEKYKAWRTKWMMRILECRSESADECWVWNGATHQVSPKAPSMLYGVARSQFTKHGYDIQFQHVHRLSYFLFNGEIGPSMTIDHICHNSLCVNPSHLRACTQAVNSSNHSEQWLHNIRAAGERRRNLRKGKAPGDHPRPADKPTGGA